MATDFPLFKMSTLDPATLAKIHTVRIHPSIGIARVGNSKADDGWFYGPEIPGRMDVPEGGFKDNGAVKRQVSYCFVYLSSLFLRSIH